MRPLVRPSVRPLGQQKPLYNAQDLTKFTRLLDLPNPSRMSGGPYVC